MVIKYCPKCEGKPYTKDYNINVCRTCGSTLLSEITSEDELRGRTEMSFLEDEPFGDFSAGGFGYDGESGAFNGDPFEDDEPNQFGFGDSNPENQFDDKFENTSSLPSEHHNYEMEKGTDSALQSPTFPFKKKSNRDSFKETRANAKNIETIIRGKITNYTNSQKENSGYRRLFVKKILDAVVYKQRFDDILHSFTVRIDNGTDTFGNQSYADIPVNVHGIIAGGIQLVDNIEVEISGNYCNGILMADNISVINNGYKSPVKFQHSAKAILYEILAIFALAFLIYIGVRSGGSFFQNIGSFLKTWLITAVIVTVLYFLASFSKMGIMARMATGKPRKFPIIGIMLVSLVIALIFINSFGIGTSVGSVLSGVISSIIPIVVLLVVLFIVFKLLLGIF